MTDLFAIAEHRRLFDETPDLRRAAGTSGRGLSLLSFRNDKLGCAMNLFADFHDLIATMLDRSRQAAACPRTWICSVSSSNRRATLRMAISPPTRPWFTPRRRRSFSPIRVSSPSKSPPPWPMIRCRRGGSGGAGLHQHPREAGGIGRMSCASSSRKDRDLAAGAAAGGKHQDVTSNMFRPTRPAPCMSAMGEARCLATRSPSCWLSPAMR